MRLYFIRHGESEANVRGMMSNRPPSLPLTARGRDQARGVAERMRGSGIAAIYSSPLLRAVQTSEALAGATTGHFEIADALREFDCGVVEDKSDEASWAIHNAVVLAWALEGEHDRRIEGGESLNDIRARFVPFLDGVIARGRDAALVAHGGLYIAMLPQVLDNIAPAYPLHHQIANTGVVVAEVRGGRLTCVDWCGERPDAVGGQ